MLPSNHRLRRTSDIKAVYSRGRSYVHPTLVVYVLKGSGEASRIGFSVSKKLGGAVVRNRIRRRLREASRSIVPRLSPGTDIVVVARRSIEESTVAEMESVLNEQFRKAGAFGEM